MKTLDEYRKELEQDPKARRRLKKLEKEFQSVEDSLTDEELVKYGLKPAEPEHEEQPSEDNKKNDAAEGAASAVIDILSHKI